MKKHLLLATVIVVCAFSLCLVHAQEWNVSDILDSMGKLPDGLGLLPQMRIPADNPQTSRKVELGRELFFEKDLSGDRSMSCSTCHDPGKGFSDGQPLAIGSHGKKLARHSPTVLNTAYNLSQFWDGRAASLEEQAKGPIMSAGEMNLDGEAELLKRLEASPHYQKEFEAVFGGRPTLNSAAKAIASYERTLVTRNSRFDQYVSGNKKALTQHEKQGLALFIGKAQCSQCHNGPNFSDSKFHNLGAAGANDSGRYAITKDPADLGSFKTPGLRNIVTHAPYMHDGSLSTLEQVIDYYDRGGNDTTNKSKLIFKLGLTQQEKSDLLSFLASLTGEVPSGPTIHARAKSIVGATDRK